MKKLKFITLIFWPLVLSLIYSSCVGTIKSADPVSTKTTANSESVLDTFEGIQNAVPISNSKVEIFFNPITAEVDKYSYIISYDGLQIPLFVAANSLKTDYRGLAKYTITNLDSNKKYTFQVQVRNISSQIQSSNNAKISATTFSNPTANFYGVSEVRNLSGSAGLNGIEVFWPEAEVRGSEIFRDEIDPIEYRISVIDSNFLTPGNMNDSTFTEPQRKVISTTSAQRNLIVNGLKPGTKYFVQVRAIHFGYGTNSANANYKTEENTNYLEITTYTDDLASLNFNNSSFFLSWPSGNGGLYALNGNWTAPVGNFDHYRMYYAIAGTTNLSSFLNSQNVDEVCFQQELQDSNVMCQEVDFDQEHAALTGLLPNTNYNVILAICLTSYCERGKRLISTVQNKTTTPPIALFNGITTISMTNDVNNLNTFTLNFLPPLFSTGNISGFLVDYYGNNPNSTNPIPLNDSAVINTSLLSVDSFDYLTATSITVRGVDYTSTDQQCFLVYPFTYTLSGTKTTSRLGLNPVCITPTLKGPAINEFSGFNSSSELCDKSLKQVALSWDLPLKGIYDNFEIFYFKSVTQQLSFADAVQDVNMTNYKRVIVDGTKTSYTLTNLATGPGAVYHIGILSRYTSSTGPIRSDFNLNTITCDFR